jgi:hypothetical protein
MIEPMRFLLVLALALVIACPATATSSSTRSVTVQAVSGRLASYYRAQPAFLRDDFLVETALGRALRLTARDAGAMCEQATRRRVRYGCSVLRGPL